MPRILTALRQRLTTKTLGYYPSWKRTFRELPIHLRRGPSLQSYSSFLLLYAYVLAVCGRRGMVLSVWVARLYDTVQHDSLPP